MSQRDQKTLQVAVDGVVSVYADLAGIALRDLNDLVIDSKQRIYVGCFGYDLGAGEPFRAGPLMRVNPDRSITIVAAGLSCANGMSLNDAEDRLYVAQTHDRNLLAFDVDSWGNLSNRRVWADLGDVRPDGISLDAEGAIWVGGIES